MDKRIHKIVGQNLATKLKMNEAIKKLSEIRRFNLKLLRKTAEETYLKQYPDSKYTNEMFAEYIGIRLAVYYQLQIPKTKPKFSEHYARKIEVEADLPMLWMDKKRENVEFSEIKLEADRVFNSMKELLQFIKNPDIKVNSIEAEDKLIKRTIEFMYSNESITQKNILTFLLEE